MGRQFCKIVAFLSVWLCACVKDKPTTHTAAKKNGHVFVVCEGSYGSGNASLWSYNGSTNTASGDVFASANATSLGDVLQSMTKAGSEYLLCINNSDRLYAIDTGTLKIHRALTIAKPRYAVATANNLAFVSTLYSNQVQVIDLASFTVKKSIELPYQNPEGMCRLNGKIYVCPWDTLCHHIYEIEEQTEAITREINIGGYAPHAVLADKYGMLWVLSGNVTKHRQATLTRIDPSTGATLRSFQFTSGEDPIKPVLNATRDTLYFIQVKYDGTALHNGIYRMSIDNAALPTSPFIPAKEFQYFWALGIDPETGNIYVGDPKGFIQKGTVTIYTASGTAVNSFDAGIGPGQFYFGD